MKSWRNPSAVWQRWRPGTDWSQINPHLTVHLNMQRHPYGCHHPFPLSLIECSSHRLHIIYLSSQNQMAVENLIKHTGLAVDCMYVFKMYVKLPVLSILQLLVLINSLTAKQSEASIHCLIIFVPLVIGTVYRYTCVL